MRQRPFVDVTTLVTSGTGGKFALPVAQHPLCWPISSSRVHTLVAEHPAWLAGAHVPFKSCGKAARPPGVCSNALEIPTAHRCGSAIGSDAGLECGRLGMYEGACCVVAALSAPSTRRSALEHSSV